MRIRAVVFDLDGLMVNTEDIFHDVGRAVMQRRGLVMSDETLLAMMGRRAPEAIQVLIDLHGLTDAVEALIEETRIEFDRMAPTRVQTMPGLLEVLAHIDRRGLPKGVATSSGRKYLDAMLTRFTLHDHFVHTLTAEDVTYGKPHPEVYLTAAERLGVKPHEMLVFEDSHAGTMAAAAAGAVVVAVPHEVSRRLDFSHATHMARRLDDPHILALLEE